MPKPGPGEILLPKNYGTEILRVEVGSTLHGTGLGVAHEDHDEMGVFVERKQSTVGLGWADHFTTRTADKDQKSQPGDTDLMTYSIKKWARLAMNGNPSVLLLLFAPDEKVIINSELGADLRANAKWFSSKKGGAAFLGYMESQRQRMVGQRGRAGRVRVTDDCSVCGGTGNGVAAFESYVCPMPGSSDVEVTGFYPPCPKCLGTGKCVDWKYAMHMCRLGYQGLEFLTTGSLTLPVPDPEGSWLREVRQGNVEFAEVIAVAESLEEQMRARLADDLGALPDQPNAKKIEDWVMNAHLKTWGLS